jgi:predicted kinase
MKVVIMSGVSGCGKSSYIDKTYPVNSRTITVSADYYFYNSDNKYEFKPADLGKAHARCLRNFVVAVASYHPLIIVDNTNTTVLEIAPYVEVARAYGADEIEIVTVQCDTKIAASRNVHGVSLEVIQAMQDRLKAREFPVYWSDIKYSSVGPF